MGENDIVLFYPTNPANQVLLDKLTKEVFLSITNPINCRTSKKSSVNTESLVNKRRLKFLPSFQRLKWQTVRSKLNKAVFYKNYSLRWEVLKKLSLAFCGFGRTDCQFQR